MTACDGGGGGNVFWASSELLQVTTAVTSSDFIWVLETSTLVTALCVPPRMFLLGQQEQQRMDSLCHPPRAPAQLR